MTTLKRTKNSRQALLLFIQEYQKEQKSFGFGRQLDHSVHLAMLNRTYEVLKQLNHVDIYIVKNGNVPHLDGAQYLLQRGDDFNDRFLSALEDTFALGYERVVAVGGDIPTLQVKDLHTAFSSTEVVVGPTHDGGFYLAALRPQDVTLFDRLPWRQAHLFDVLNQRMRAKDIACQHLPIRKDIDHRCDASENMALLMLLVKRWMRAGTMRCQFPSVVRNLPVNRIPEPRFSSLPPPSIPSPSF